MKVFAPVPVPAPRDPLGWFLGSPLVPIMLVALGFALALLLSWV